MPPLDREVREGPKGAGRAPALSMRSAAATPASACTTDPGGRGHNPGPSRPAPPEGAPGGGLPAVGVDLIGTDPPIDPSTPSGRLLFHGSRPSESSSGTSSASAPEPALRPRGGAQSSPARRTTCLKEQYPSGLETVQLGSLNTRSRCKAVGSAGQGSSVWTAPPGSNPCQRIQAPRGSNATSSS